MDLLVDILYALPVYQSFALALLLFLNSEATGSTTRRIMAWFQLSGAVYFSFNFLYAVHYFSILKVLYAVILPVVLVFLPVFYLYLLAATTPGFHFSKRQFFHFLPSLLLFAANFPFLLIPENDKLMYLMSGFPISGGTGVSDYLLAVYIIGLFGLLPLQLLYYTRETIKLYRKHKVYILNNYSYTENISLNRIVTMAVSLAVFFISNQVLYLSGLNHSFFSPVIYNLVMLVIMLFTGYYAFVQKDLKSLPVEQQDTPGPLFSRAFTGSEPIRRESNTTGFPGMADTGAAQEDREIAAAKAEQGFANDSGLLKYAGSPLSDDRKSMILIDLQRLMGQEKLYTKEDLCIDDIAIQLKTNSKYVSQVINETYGKNFYYYINAYRIEEAKNLLASDGLKLYSITGIARMVGFGSKSSFNASFKRHTGLTPTEFAKGLQK
ncbi:MAG: helix-turn-helix transcriptional regulator [Bacteroidales bacterium]|jgi:AraC-like DNA-binding protein|nr:helix-turn-helix transcriptional regulator [Bacteroidales bacterium]